MVATIIAIRATLGMRSRAYVSFVAQDKQDVNARPEARIVLQEKVPSVIVCKPDAFFHAACSRPACTFLRRCFPTTVAMSRADKCFASPGSVQPKSSVRVAATSLASSTKPTSWDSHASSAGDVEA